MDPDLVKELEDQLRQLSEMVSQQTAAMSGLTAALGDSTSKLSGVAASSNKLTNSQSENEKAITQNTNGAGALQRANKQAADIRQAVAENMSKAMYASVTGLKGFTSAVLSSEQGFTKYNSAIGSAGDAAWNVGKNFGILGVVLGGLLKVGSEVLQYQTKQADGLLTATDSLAKMGAGGAFTAEQVRKMGADAGLTSLELDKLIKPMQSVKGGFVALGGTQAEGMKKFGEMAAVSEDVRREFKRLGMGDQERNQSLADFVSLMNASGQAATGALGTQQGLQKAALDYTRNMYELSSITGDDVETAKKKHQAATDTYEFALFNNKMAQDIANATAKRDNAKTAQERASAQAELDQLNKKDAAFKRMTLEMEKARMSPEEIAAAQNMIITGAVTETSKSLAIRQMPIQQLWSKAINGTLEDGEVAQAQNKSVNDFVNRVGHGTMALSKEVQELSGISKEYVGWAGQHYGDSMIELAKAGTKAIEDNKNGKGPAGTDPAQKARNDLTEAERKAKLTIDAYAAKYNPLLGNTSMLSKLAWAAGLAAGALALMAGKQAFDSVSDFFGGLKKGGKNLAANEAEELAGKATAAERRAASKAAAKEAAVARAARSGASIAGKEGAAASKGLRGLLPGGLKAGAKAMFKPGNILKLGKTLGKGVAGIIGGLALDAGAEYATKHGHEKIGAGLDTASSALTGASIGATIGSIVPGLGTVVGGAVGGAIGGLYGLWTNRKSLLPSVFGDTAAKETEKPAPPPKPPTALETLKSVLDQINLIQKYNFDPGIVSNNAEALSSFASALASVFDINISGDNPEEKAKAIADSTAAFNNAQPPLEKFVQFSNLDINLDKAKNNSEAYVAFAHAMSEYKGVGGSGLSKITNAISMGILEHFKVKLPLEDFKKFADMTTDPKKVDKNAKSFVSFANAMAEYKGGPGLLDSISSLLGKGFRAITGQDGPIQAFKDFAKDDYGPNMEKNADAFLKYAQAKALAGSPTDAGMPPPNGGNANNANNPLKTGYNAGKKAASAAGDLISSGADLVANAFDWIKAGITGKPTDVLNFTGQSGKYENFAALDANMQKSVVLAATDYKKTTGRKMTVNSARRSVADQERLWAETERLGTPGRGPGGMLVAKPPRLGGNPPHLRGNAIDLQEGKSDPRVAMPILARYGLKQTYSGRDPVHFDLKAMDGGLFTGPGGDMASAYIGSNSGKMKAALDPNSILMKLAKPGATAKDAINAVNASTPKKKTPDNHAREQATMNLELYGMISRKVDAMIDLLESSHDTHNKMLSHAKV